MIWVKFCGTTNYEDALLAWESSADAIGFVLVESSKRYVRPSEIRSIVDQLARPVERIGVIQNIPLEKAVSLVNECGLSGLQLHGDELPEYVRDLRNRLPRARLIKTLHMGSETDLIEEISSYESCGADNFLLDSVASASQKNGGTGIRFDWSAASTAVIHSGNKLPLIIAGGLTPENVREAIDVFRPFGVDVVTGVEREPGKKDPVKLRAFVQAARTRDQEKVEIV